MWKCPSSRFLWRLMTISTRRQREWYVFGEAETRDWVEARAEMADTLLSVSSMFHCVMHIAFWSSRWWMALEIRRK